MLTTDADKPKLNRRCINMAIHGVYWQRHFNVSEDELKKVTAKVGNSAAAVRKELQQHSPNK